MCTALTDDNRAGLGARAVVELNPQIFGLGITEIFSGAAGFFMRHGGLLGYNTD